MSALRDLLRRTSVLVHEQVAAWRTGSQRSQMVVLGCLLVGVSVSFTISWINYDLAPLTAYFVWLLLGMLLLRFAPLLALTAVTMTAAVTAMLHAGDMTLARASASLAFLVSTALVLYTSSRQRSGLPVTLGEAMLTELRDRLQAQGVVPPLPPGWDAQSAMRSSQGLAYAGDFFVADLSDDARLEMVLVDVCGKGVSVGPQALQFAGALGGLLGSLPQGELFRAANRFLLRQDSDESFATAVHVSLDLSTGEYSISSAGHPPALRWCSSSREWEIDGARGMALGILPDPDLHATHGVLAPGDALMFYTDGVVETRDADLDVGIDWLRDRAREAVAGGFPGAARRIIRQVPAGDDDRAVLILSRDLQPAALVGGVGLVAAPARPVATE